MESYDKFEITLNTNLAASARGQKWSGTSFVNFSIYFFFSYFKKKKLLNANARYLKFLNVNARKCERVQVWPVATIWK